MERDTEIETTEIEATLLIREEERDAVEDLELEVVSMDAAALSLISSRRC